MGGVLPPLAAGAAALLAGLAALLRRGSSSSATAVPLVNLTALALNDPAELAVLKDAAQRLGVFRLVGHSVDGASVLNASKAFFELPLPAKLATSAAAAGGAFQRGYIPLGGESGLKDFFEVKEGFCYGHAWEDDQVWDAQWANNLTGPNSWPDASHGLGEGWRATLEGFFGASAGLAARLVGQLPKALGPAEGLGPGGEGAEEGLGRAWASLCEGGEPISIMRLFHYFSETHLPQLGQATPRIGSSPHTDWHMLTVILQDTQGGLQVLAPGGGMRGGGGGQWLEVPAREGELTVLLGDYLHWLSGGRTVSPIHRVLLPPHGAERYSFTFFSYPSYDASVPVDAARRAAEARQRQQQRRRRGGPAPRINTLTPGGSAGERMLAERPFGEILEDKWRGVASNGLDG